jgi:uncharacterized membrane protein
MPILTVILIFPIFVFLMSNHNHFLDHRDLQTEERVSADARHCAGDHGEE